MHVGRVVFGKMDEVVFGRPAAEALNEQVERLGAWRAILMVSGTLNRQTDEIERIRKALGSRCAAVFDAMPAHTPRKAVVAATQMARAAEADVIVTVGGGSITDGAKAVQLCLANGVQTAEDIDALRVAGAAAPKIKPPTIRQISVPTTISGGEFSSIAGVTNESTKTKEMLRHELVMPSAVILDPAITVHTPEWLWLSTGIRAVDHCVEGICSREAHPYGDAQAIKGLSLLAQALPKVKADPRDLDARLDCQLGTWLSMGPLSSGVPMGASHGIGYVLGTVFGVPHGHTSCIMLPAVMRWWRRRWGGPETRPPTRSIHSFAGSACRGRSARRRSGLSISTGSRPRRWERRGSPAIPARSTDRRRSWKFWKSRPKIGLSRSRVTRRVSYRSASAPKSHSGLRGGAVP